jgi:hypothetical protein
MTEKGNPLLALLIPISVCVFFIIVIILAFQWSNSNSVLSPTTTGTNFYPNSTTQPTQQTPVATGTIYTNAAYGFQVDYLDSANTPTQVYGTSPVVLGSSGLSIQELHINNGAFSDSTMTNKNATCLIPANSAQNSAFFSFKDSESVGNVTAYHYANYPNPNARFCDNPAGCFYYDIYRIAHDSQCYEIVFEREGGSTQIPSNVSQILSSFQFNQ